MSYQPPPPTDPYQPYQQTPQAGWPPPPGYQLPQMPRPPRRRHTVRNVLMALAGVIILIIIVVGNVVGSSGSGGDGGQTVTYVVTGSPADVTYGPAGSDRSGTVPMRRTVPAGNPSYYAITAQLQGGGQVECRILVGGRVVSWSVASGGYNIASCEIVQGLSGWEDANSG